MPGMPQRFGPVGDVQLAVDAGHVESKQNLFDNLMKPYDYNSLAISSG